jgi:hypothetical protein
MRRQQARHVHQPVVDRVHWVLGTDTAGGRQAAGEEDGAQGTQGRAGLLGESGESGVSLESRGRGLEESRGRGLEESRAHATYTQL